MNDTLFPKTATARLTNNQNALASHANDLFVEHVSYERSGAMGLIESTLHSLESIWILISPSDYLVCRSTSNFHNSLLLSYRSSIRREFMNSVLEYFPELEMGQIHQDVSSFTAIPCVTSTLSRELLPSVCFIPLPRNPHTKHLLRTQVIRKIRVFKNTFFRLPSRQPIVSLCLRRSMTHSSVVAQTFDATALHTPHPKKNFKFIAYKIFSSRLSFENGSFVRASGFSWKSTWESSLSRDALVWVDLSLGRQRNSFTNSHLISEISPKEFLSEIESEREISVIKLSGETHTNCQLDTIKLLLRLMALSLNSSRAATNVDINSS